MVDARKDMFNGVEEEAAITHVQNRISRYLKTLM